MADDEKGKNLVAYQTRSTDISVPRVNGIVDAAFTHWRANRHKEAYLEIAKMLDAKTMVAEAYVRTQRQVAILHDLDNILDDDQAERDEERAERTHQREANRRRREREAKSWEAEAKVSEYDDAARMAEAENTKLYQERRRDTTRSISEHQQRHTIEKFKTGALSKEVERLIVEEALNQQQTSGQNEKPSAKSDAEPTVAARLETVLQEIDDRIKKAASEEPGDPAGLAELVRFRDDIQRKFDALQDADNDGT